MQIPFDIYRYQRDSIAALNALRKKASDPKRLFATIKKPDVSVFLFSKPRERNKSYKAMGERAQRHRHTFLRDVFDEIGMDMMDVLGWVLSDSSVQRNIPKELSTSGSKIQRTLNRLRIQPPLPQKYLASLLIAQDTSGRQAQFMKSYIGAGITRRQLETEKRMKYA